MSSRCKNNMFILRINIMFFRQFINNSKKIIYIAFFLCTPYLKSFALMINRQSNMPSPLIQTQFKPLSCAWSGTSRDSYPKFCKVSLHCVRRIDYRSSFGWTGVSLSLCCDYGYLINQIKRLSYCLSLRMKKHSSWRSKQTT